MPKLLPRSDSLRALQRARDLLADELGLDPGWNEA